MTKTVFYSDFGAVGDGVTDDFAAICQAHEYANAAAVPCTVKATPGAIYYIGTSSIGKTIPVQTDVDWTGAKLIFDDSYVKVDGEYDSAGNVVCENRAGTHKAPLFWIQSDTPAESYTEKFQGRKLRRGDENIGFAPGREILLAVYDEAVRHFIRYGPNADSGQAQQEILLVHADGSIDPTTPLQWDYDSVSSAFAYAADDRPITLTGGEVETISNRGPNEYYYYGRGIKIQRSNVTVDGLHHALTGTQRDESGRVLRSPYVGFTQLECAHNVMFRNMVIQDHDFSYNAAGVLLGTYEINAARCNKVLWENCVQRNFFEADGSVKFRGAMGTNYCKNLAFDGCFMSSFDAHCGTYNATLRNSTCEHINFIGAGTITLENMTIYADGSRTGIILRDDYGSTWDGDLVIHGLTLKYARELSELTLIRATYCNHDFGYVTYLPRCVTIDGVKLEKITAAMVDGAREETLAATNAIPLHLYRNGGRARKELEDYTDVDISDRTACIDGAANKNPYMPTEHVTVKNCGNLQLILPHTPQFSRMKVEGE